MEISVSSDLSDLLIFFSWASVPSGTRESKRSPLRRSYSSDETRWKKWKHSKEKREKSRVGSNAHTAEGTWRREVLLSGRGPLSSRWWQVSVAALVAGNGRRFAEDVSSLCHLSRAHAGVRNKSTSRVLHERQEFIRWRRRQETRTSDPRTMRHAIPGVTPPPRSDATATRYAPYTRCYMIGSERASSVWDTIVKELSRRKPDTRIFLLHSETLFTLSRCDCIYHILFILLYKK